MIGCGTSLFDLEDGLINLESNCRPWSECNCSRGENRKNISFTSAVATVVASMFGRGYASTHLVKYSTATKRYLLPAGLVGNGPRSMALENQQQHLIMVPSGEVLAFYEMHNQDRCSTNTPHLYSDLANKTLLLAY